MTHTKLTTTYALLALPATLAHEVTHALASVPWAKQLALVIEPSSGRAVVRVDWRESAGAWGRRVAALAPFAGGLLAGLVALYLWIRNGAAAPENGTQMAKWCLFSVYWLIYMTPSADDLATARGGNDGN